jgi:zinc transporter
MSVSPSPGILFALACDGTGGATSLADAETISRELRNPQLCWVHLDVNADEARTWLEREITYLDAIIRDALLAEETRPRSLVFQNGILLILRGVNPHPGADPEDMISIRLWIDADRIISLERRPLPAVYEIADLLRAGRGPKNAGDFLVALVDRLTERLEPVITALDDATDSIEEQVMERPTPTERQPIVDIRRRAIVFRRHLLPQRDVIAHLRLSDQLWLDANHRRHLQENYDSLQRAVEEIDTIRERAQIVKDELTNTLADRLNRNLYMLSVVAAIFLPLSFLTGLLGINIGGIPGANNPEAFWAFLGFLAVLVLCEVSLFKWLKWF